MAQNRSGIRLHRTRWWALGFGVPLLVVVLAAAGCSTAPNPDEAGLEYDAGPFSATTFSNCIAPGNREYRGPGDQFFLYPAGQRTFEFAEGKDAEIPEATVVSKDDLELRVTGLVTFSLNTDCETLRQFHERIGIKYQAHDSDGWVQMLREYIGHPLNRAIDDATKAYNWRDLYTSAETKGAWEKAVGQLTAKYIAEQGGEAFFCSPVFVPGSGGDCGDPQLTIQQPVPPEPVRAALTDTQRAIEATRAQQEENIRVTTELEAIRRLVEVLGPNGYVLYQAIKDGKVQVVPVPNGVDVNISPGR
ncbi:SPFH domain-containing protein [Nocardia sp. NPDC051832]|uniref:SPFH domain-containing protein n=1 Tax=Nocardia sp. NPDC051832 TaxID=3155673 RepID=UPI00342967C1